MSEGMTYQEVVNTYQKVIDFKDSQIARLTAENAEMRAALDHVRLEAHSQARRGSMIAADVMLRALGKFAEPPADKEPQA